MASLNDLKNGAIVRGIVPNQSVHIVSLDWIGDQAVNVAYRDESGAISERTLFRDDEHGLELDTDGYPWSFDADGELLRLVTEANRIKLAHYFDPYLAIHTSLVDPLPHQISAVYEEMLPRQPLRFLLADDPGAGKTIMAGLLIKELIARSDLDRCLVVAPGSLVEQWQDELGEKFNLEFDILTRDMIESSRSGNPFNDRNRLIVRLDVLARNEELQEKLVRSTEWDLVICDEAHRMSATYFGGDVKYTKRYQLGQKLGEVCRHLLLMSATPHNGKEEDFQLFMALLDGDRFEGRFRDGVHLADTEDMMRRLTKEELLKFDGKPLFPERRAYTVKYQLSPDEAALYSAVTEYVRTEMNRVQRFAEDDGRKRNNVGFALQILQRRLASSPAAIYQSLKRRRERLESELGEARLVVRGKRVREGNVSDEILKNIDEYGQDEIDDLEELISTSATTAETVEQLELEVQTLKGLEQMALNVLRSGKDTKWTQLDRILDDELMTDSEGNRRKLIIFTEPKDTLFYLLDKVRARIGDPNAVDVIHGGVTREERRNVVERFMQDKDFLVLIANDAAGEGVNLQRGHLMVNYDLPWNPNKIEQRFGRIHRIGQMEVCHLWNLVAADTREGEVYSRLLEKLEAAREALGGRVYDVLGELFEGAALKDLLFEAIQYGEQEEVRARLFKAVDGAVDQKHLMDLLQRRQLTNDTMPAARVQELRLEMEKAEAQRLQPHHIQSFFVEAFERLGGKIKRREEGRWEITHVPLDVRERDRQIGTSIPIQKKYERICFEKSKINQQPVATFVCPGHPLLEAVISLVREKYDYMMKQGAVLIDDTDDGEEISALFLLEHAVQDGRTTSASKPHTISQRLWARTVPSPNPAVSGAPIPLVASFWLCKKAKKQAWVEPIVQGTNVEFVVRRGTPADPDAVAAGTKQGRGANFRCILTGDAVTADYVKAQGMAGKMGWKLLAIVAEGKGGRRYVSPSKEQEEIAFSEHPEWRPEFPLSQHPQYMSVTNYGPTNISDLFMDRQTIALNTFINLIPTVISSVEADPEYIRALSTYLTLGVSRLANRQSTSTFWENSAEKIQQVFAMQALPMRWDTAEGNPFSTSSGNFIGQVEYLAKNIAQAPCRHQPGQLEQRDATMVDFSGKVISTDPPYYDNVPYADLSDFFYVWLRKGLKGQYPELFQTMLAPKAEELVADHQRHGGRDQADLFFLEGMTEVMRHMAEQGRPDIPATIYYAFRQGEVDEGGLSSKGWVTFLQSVISAGYQIGSPFDSKSPSSEIKKNFARTIEPSGCC